MLLLYTRVWCYALYAAGYAGLPGPLMLEFSIGCNYYSLVAGGSLTFNKPKNAHAGLKSCMVHYLHVDLHVSEGHADNMARDRAPLPL